ncbi:MAG: hypothetical protein RR482_06725, partial [Clostridia bacterium]
VELGESALGNIQRVENLAKGLVTTKAQDEARLDTARTQLVGAKTELDKPWPQEQELREKSERLTQLNVELNVGGNDVGAAAFGEDEDEPETENQRPVRAREAAR